MTKKKRRQELAVAGTVPLWPDAGQQLGLGKNGTYAAAHRGEIEGLLKFGRCFRVAVPALRRMLEEGHKGLGRK
jgi:hypothetical protein